MPRKSTELDQFFLDYWDKTIHHPLRDMSQDDLYDAIMESRKVNEPTIDEMLKVLDNIPETYLNDKEIDAIRAILEQHKDNPRQLGEGLTHEYLLKQQELQTIRAFVERVFKRVTTSDISTWNAMKDELAAMEQQND